MQPDQEINAVPWARQFAYRLSRTDSRSFRWSVVAGEEHIWRISVGNRSTGLAVGLNFDTPLPSTDAFVLGRNGEMSMASVS
jgi:hypothetical protein